MAEPTDKAPLLLKDGDERMVSRQQVLRAMEEFDRAYVGTKNNGWSASDRRRGYCVRENEKRYPAKRLLSLVTRLPLNAFGGAKAMSTLGALGFELRRGEVDDGLGLNGEDADDAETEQAEEVTFGVERDLQGALRSNIAQLETGLKISDGGREQVTQSGRIDITAEDGNGATVVIELKAGAADREAIGQILAYMGDLAVKRNQVRGILVAGEFSPRAVAAARVVPNLQLRTYSFKFTFESPKGFSQDF